jgi:hypothetical protein
MENISLLPLALFSAFWLFDMFSVELVRIVLSFSIFNLLYISANAALLIQIKEKAS